MDTTSLCAAGMTAAHRGLLAVTLTLLCVGCKSNPTTNPFAERDKADKAAQEKVAERGPDKHSDETTSAAEALEAEGEALKGAAAGLARAAIGLGKEAKATAEDAADRVKQAAVQTRDQAEQDVRQVAAQTVATAKSAARDAQASLQRQAIEALATWPIVEAGPVLIVAIAEGDASVRRAAAEQLAARWPRAEGFPVEAAAERRAVALAELKKLWAAQYGEINDQVVATRAEVQQLITLSEAHAREVQQCINDLQQADLTEVARREAIAQLASTGPPLVAVLEQKLASGGALPVEVYSEVLPGMVPAFAALARFSSSDVVERRAAAAELAVQASALALSPLAVTRLSDLLEAEKDPIVWRSALAAVATDAQDASIRMAYRALDNASADVRRDACEHLAAHGNPQHAERLLKALDDPDAMVVLASVRALGSVGTLDDQQALVRMLDASDKALQLEAAISLARLRTVQGTVALDRMARDADLQVRLRAAQAISETSDAILLPTLAAMLSDQAEVQRAAMIGMARIAGTDIAASQGGRPLTDAEKVERWRYWYQKRRTPVETARRP